VCPCVVDANLDCVRFVWRHGALGDGEATVARFHLDAVVGDTQADREAKRP
jgi:hypothetical protein